MPPTEIDRVYKLIDAVKSQLTAYITDNQIRRERRLVEDTKNKIHFDALKVSVDKLHTLRREEKKNREKWIDNVLFKVVWKVVSFLLLGFIAFKLGW